tara:strand:- start:867 stop:2423 length:1557 start_codon:yes stop_codon:yes gene_type:complete
VNDDLDNFMEKGLFSEIKDLLSYGKVGFEKESLRVINSSIAQSPHPGSLGSALCNQYITTDFSEAQLELVTPPFQDKQKALRLLDDVHHFISCNLEDEILWPFSMPVAINAEEDIPIAYYGPSNLGAFKRIYRNGLSHRYGRMMQAISGVHYNYSVPNSIWQSSLFKNMEIDSKRVRSAAYFNMLRNIYRINWLILYLFGASPTITRNFLTEDNHSFKQLDKQTLFLPYATSLRMSNFGYQNTRRKKLEVSINSIAEYISGLRKATNTAHSEFAKIQKKNTNFQAQINENILQIDDEYYAVARAKSKIISDQRTTSKLNQGGVDFIELRSLDLNPFSRIGIDKETTLFLEVLLAYCFIKQGQYFTDDEITSINHNDALVATKGREPMLKLLKDGETISLKDWGNQIIENLLPIAAVLDSNKNQYTEAVDQMREKINDSNQTLSGRLLDKIYNNNMSFIELGENIGKANKMHYLNLNQSENASWDLLEKETIDSHTQQKKLENNDGESFEAFVENYFKY